MGTRLNVEFGDKGSPALVLFCNVSHAGIEPRGLIRKALASCGPHQITDAAEKLLQLRYPSTSGNNRAGDRIFSLDLEPGDREAVIRVLSDLDVSEEAP